MLKYARSGRSRPKGETELKRIESATSVKKNAALAVAVLLTVLIAILCRFFIQPKSDPSDPAAQTEQIDAGLDEQIFSALRYRYLSGVNGETRGGECYAEAHRVLGTEERDGKTVVYAVVSEGDLGFVNGYFTEVSGSSCIPTVLSFTGEPENAEIRTPQDGALFASSVRGMFPEKIAKTILRDPGKYGEELWQEMAKDAVEYLRSIGREAEIKRMYETGTSTLTDHGVSVEVANALAEDGSFDRYPFYGTAEHIENGVRYVYSTSCADGRIVYEKYPFGGDPAVTAVERYVLDASNGVMLDSCAVPALPDENLDRLRELYPVLFTMDVSAGVDVYIWQVSENDFYGWIMPRGNAAGETADAQLTRVFSALTPEDIREILAYRGADPERVKVIPYQHPLSSYLWLSDGSFLNDGMSEERLRSMLGLSS